MLFSDKHLTKYLNDNFECAWQMLRPVPIMSVDFGDGRVLSRSMHGNVATYVCNSDRKVIDVIPGIYGPRTYQFALEKLQTLARELSEAKSPELSLKLRQHHNAEISRISSEMNLITLGRLCGIKIKPKTTKAEPEVQMLGDENYHRGVIADNTISETSRRLAIHKILTEHSYASPEQITRTIYKQCLDLDLDDPYLGLAGALASNYPGESAD